MTFSRLLRQITPHRKALALIVALLLAGSAFAEPRVRPVEWAQPVIEAELGNFYRVSDELYRSQQPDEQEIKELATMGIRSMLNLCHGSRHARMSSVAYFPLPQYGCIFYSASRSTCDGCLHSDGGSGGFCCWSLFFSFSRCAQSHPRWWFRC